jgi:hypothetical protein
MVSILSFSLSFFQGKEIFKTPVNIEVSQVSKEARKTIESVGGKVTTIYLTRLGVRTVFRYKPEEIRIGFALCPPKYRSRFDVWRYVPPPLRTEENFYIGREREQQLLLQQQLEEEAQFEAQEAQQQQSQPQI